MREIDFQSLFLGTLGSVGPVTFRRFLDTEHVRVLAPAYPHLLEVVATLLVIERVDGEYLLLLYRVSPRMAAMSSYLSLNLDWSSSILTSELLMMASFTIGESITSLSSCVTTPAMPVKLADGLVEKLDILGHCG